MAVDSNLNALADSSPFIFTGYIERVGASTVPVILADANTVVVLVEDVTRAPIGLPSFAGGRVTVRLLEPLAAGRYVFFADPWAVGGGLAVKERAHLDATAQTVSEQVAAAAENGYAERMAPGIRTARLVALGTIGAVRSLYPPGERPRGAPWALAPLEIERVLKGDVNSRRVVLVGPRYASRWVPLVPPLRPGLRAIFILRLPPPQAIAAVPEGEREGLLFLAAASDIQPEQRVTTIGRIASVTR
jgi:hypothetical protein